MRVKQKKSSRWVAIREAREFGRKAARENLGQCWNPKYPGDEFVCFQFRGSHARKAWRAFKKEKEKKYILRQITGSKSRFLKNEVHKEMMIFRKDAGLYKLR